MGARDSRDGTVADLTSRTAAERAQASMFASLLRGELATMTRNVAKAEANWRSRCEADGEADPPERLLVVRERMSEVARMLDALDGRFLRKR